MGGQAYHLPQDTVIVGERLGEAEEHNGPGTLGGDGALQEVVEEESTAGLDAVLDKGNAPRYRACATDPKSLVEEIGSGRRESRIHLVRFPVHRSKGCPIKTQAGRKREGGASAAVLREEEERARCAVDD